MARFRKRVITEEERNALPLAHIRRLNRMLKALQELAIESPYCERELKEIKHKVRTVRNIYQGRMNMKTEKVG